MMNKKAMMDMRIISVIIVASLIFLLGFFTVTKVGGSIPLLDATTDLQISDETITGSNTTRTALTKSFQIDCIEVTNATNASIVLGTTDYNCNDGGLLVVNDTYNGESLNVTFNYTQKGSEDNTMDSVKGNVRDGFELASIVMILIAAVSIFGIVYVVFKD